LKVASNRGIHVWLPQPKIHERITFSTQEMQECTVASPLSKLCFTTCSYGICMQASID